MYQPSQVLPPGRVAEGDRPIFAPVPASRREIPVWQHCSAERHRLGFPRGRKSRFLIINPNSPGYDAPSRQGTAYLLFLRRDQLMAQPFDAGTAAVSGEPVSVAEPLQAGGPSFSASENGVLIFRRSRAGASSPGSTGTANHWERPGMPVSFWSQQ
jgi:hypothetical protein